MSCYNSRIKNTCSYSCCVASLLYERHIVVQLILLSHKKRQHCLSTSSKDYIECVLSFSDRRFCTKSGSLPGLHWNWAGHQISWNVQGFSNEATLPYGMYCLRAEFWCIVDFVVYLLMNGGNCCGMKGCSDLRLRLTTLVTWCRGGRNWCEVFGSSPVETGRGVESWRGGAFEWF